MLITQLVPFTDSQLYISEISNPSETISLLISPTLTTIIEPKSNFSKSNPANTASSSIASPLVLCSLIHNSAKLFSYWVSTIGEEEEIWLPTTTSIDGNNQDKEKLDRELLEQRRKLILNVIDGAKVLDRGYERLEKSEDAEVQERVSSAMFFWIFTFQMALVMLNLLQIAFLTSLSSFITGC